MKSNITTNPVSVKMLRLADSPLPKSTKLPKQLEIRRAQIEDATNIAELCSRAYINENWTTKTTELELFHDSSVKAVLIVTDKMRLVATASLQVHKNVPHSTQVRWVATEADMRRQGLAKTLVIRLLEISIEEGYKDTYLQTTTDALGAISLYLQLGFKPIIDNNKEREVWNELYNLIGGNSSF